MILVALAIGAILVVAAIRNSQGALFTALIADVPAFVVWAAALIAIGAVGFIPGLKPVSRGLLALVLTVLVLNNWTQIQAGFTAAASDTTGTSGSAATVAPTATPASTSASLLQSVGAANTGNAASVSNALADLEAT